MTCFDPFAKREFSALTFALKRALSEMNEEYWSGDLEESYEKYQIADFFSTMLYQFCLEKNVDRDSLSEIKELLDRFEPVLESLKNGLEFFA